MNNPPRDDETTLVPFQTAEDRSLRALTRVAEALSIEAEPEALLREALRGIVGDLGLEGGSALLAVENGRLELAAEHGAPAPKPETLHELAAMVVQWERPIVQGLAQGGWSAATPIRSRDRRLGALLLHAGPGVLPPHREVLGALGRQIGAGIENARLYGELRAAAARSESLARINRALSASLDLKAGIAELAREMQPLQRFSRLCCAFLNDAGDYLEVVSQPEGAGWGLGTVVPAVGSGLGFAVLNDKPLLEPELAQSQRFIESPELREEGVGSYLLLPLRTRGRCSGVLGLAANEARAFSEETLSRLQPVADAVALALDNLRLFQKTKDLAVTDDVTVLYNARFIHQVLEREIKFAQRYKSPLSIVFLDLDRFKPVNDQHGHLRGSRVLREVGFLLHAEVRETDYPARYGGDEFVVLLPHTDEAGARQITDRLQQTIEETVYLQEEGLDIRLGASAGCATCPTEAMTKEALLALADRRMYENKEQRRARLP